MGSRSTNTGKGLNTRLDGHILGYFRNTFVRGGGAGSTLQFNASGGTILTPGNGYTYHIFTGPGTFTISTVGATGTVDYVIVTGEIGTAHV